MRVITRRRLREFWASHPDAEQPLRAWYSEANRASWKTTADIKARYASVSFVGTRVVFNIGGNKYRLVTLVRYATGKVFIRFVGTHAEYDKLDVASI